MDQFCHNAFCQLTRRSASFGVAALVSVQLEPSTHSYTFALTTESTPLLGQLCYSWHTRSSPFQSLLIAHCSLLLLLLLLLRRWWQCTLRIDLLSTRCHTNMRASVNVNPLLMTNSVACNDEDKKTQSKRAGENQVRDRFACWLQPAEASSIEHVLTKTNVAWQKPRCAVLYCM